MIANQPGPSSRTPVSSRSEDVRGSETPWEGRVKANGRATEMLLARGNRPVNNSSADYDFSHDVFAPARRDRRRRACGGRNRIPNLSQSNDRSQNMAANV